jgi:predicted RNase H-like HicB family nuclease
MKEAMKYLIVIEKAARNYSAYVPDLPGCIATGRNLRDLKKKMRQAIDFHLDGMKEDGLPIPLPTTCSEYIRPKVA